MRAIFSWSRFAIWIAVITLLVASVAVFIFGMISTGSVIYSVFAHGPFNAVGAREFSVELIEMIDLFLLGTILFITSVGLQELFIDPNLEEVLPDWMSVRSLDELKFNLLAVIVVMLAVLFLGIASSYELVEGVSILNFGGAVALVIAAAGVSVYLFARVHHMRIEGEIRDKMAEASESSGRPVDAVEEH